VTEWRYEPGVGAEKVRSKEQTWLGGNTCGGVDVSSGRSSLTPMLTSVEARISESTVKARTTFVCTEKVPKSMSFGPPVIWPSSDAESVALHSAISSDVSGRGLYFLPPTRIGSKSCDESPALASQPSP
jgi:hypothetical protein